MAKIFLLLTFLLLTVNGSAQDRDTGVFRYSETSGTHTAKLIVTVKPFDRSKHQITFADAKYLKQHQIEMANGAKPYVTKIDGRGWYGSDGDIPRRQISSMVISFDGMKIDVPPSLFADCYEPNLAKDYFATKLSENGDSLLIFMAASDAAGSYQIMWILRKDGHHSRFINDCSDCEYKDIFNFFLK